MTTPALHPAAPVVKHFPLEVKAVDAESTATLGVFTGIASAVGVLDRHHEVIEKGAFDADLTENGATRVLLWQHDPGKPIGVIHLSTDQRGDLVAKGEINLETTQGREAYALLKQGAIGAMSIGFNIPDGGAAFDAKAGVLRILAVQTWETSLVTFPANPAAVVDSVKQAFGMPTRTLSTGEREQIASTITRLQAALDADQPREEKSLQAPNHDPVELAGVKELVALISRELSEGDPAA